MRNPGPNPNKHYRTTHQSRPAVAAACEQLHHAATYCRELWSSVACDAFPKTTRTIISALDERECDPSSFCRYRNWHRFPTKTTAWWLPWMTLAIEVTYCLELSLNAIWNHGGRPYTLFLDWIRMGQPWFEIKIVRKLHLSFFFFFDLPFPFWFSKIEICLERRGFDCLKHARLIKFLFFKINRLLCFLYCLKKNSAVRFLLPLFYFFFKKDACYT